MQLLLTRFQPTHSQVPVRTFRSSDGGNSDGSNVHDNSKGSVRGSRIPAHLVGIVCMIMPVGLTLMNLMQTALSLLHQLQYLKLLYLF
jgi:hypothetical protein